MTNSIVQFGLLVLLIVAGRYAMLFWARNRNSSNGQVSILSAIRYGGYVIVGAGIGLLFAAVLITQSITSLPHTFVVLGLTAFGIILGLLVAYKFPGSLR